MSKSADISYVTGIFKENVQTFPALCLIWFKLEVWFIDYCDIWKPQDNWL